MLLCVACGGSPAAPDIMDYMRVGVTPRDEAEAVSASMDKDGWTLVTRVDGERVVALAFRMPGDARAAVRVITRRGVAIAMDAPSEAWSGDVFLDTSLGTTATDLDGDGNEEVVLGTGDVALLRRCMEVFHVVADGSVVPMSVPSPAPFRDACVVRFTNVTGDQRPEVVTVVRDDAVSFDTVASVEMPLVSAGGHWRRPPEEVMTRFCEPEQRAREAEIASLLGGKAVLKSVPQILRLGYELAMLSRLRGDSAEAARDVFLRATAGAGFPQESGAQRAEIAQAIATRWALVPPPSQP